MKFIHVSDTHIGCEIPTKYREIRKEDFIKSFEFVVNYAIEEKVDFIIHSGDLLDNYYRFNSYLTLKLFEILNKLKENNIPIFVIRGNHDVKGQKNYVIDLLKKLDLIKEPSINNHYEIKDANIYGISEPQNYSGENLRRYYEIVFKKINIKNEGFNIFLFHGVSSLFFDELPFREYRIIGLEHFPNVDYYAFGHFHQHKILIDNGKYFVLPGSTERTDVSKIEEKDNKGFYLYNDGDIRFVDINVRPMYILDYEINKEEDIIKLKENIERISRESIIKIRIRHNKGLKGVIRKFLNDLEDIGYKIIEDLDVFENEEINFNENILEFKINEGTLFFVDKGKIMEIFNYIKEKIEDLYSEEREEISDRDIDKIREDLFNKLQNGI